MSQAETQKLQNRFDFRASLLFDRLNALAYIVLLFAGLDIFLQGPNYATKEIFLGFGLLFFATRVFAGSVAMKLTNQVFELNLSTFERLLTIFLPHTIGVLSVVLYFFASNRSITALSICTLFYVIGSAACSEYTFSINDHNYYICIGRP